MSFSMFFTKVTIPSGSSECKFMRVQVPSSAPSSGYKKDVSQKTSVLPRFFAVCRAVFSNSNP